VSRQIDRPKLKLSTFRKLLWPWRFIAGKKKHNLLTVTSQFVELIQVNAPLVEGLETLSADVPDVELKILFLNLRDDVASGMPFHEALAKYPRFFPRHYIDLIKTGEETGKLGYAVRELEDELIRSLDFREKLRGYFAYIGFELFILFFFGTFLLLWVIPQFQNIFDSMGGSLPASTRLLISISDFARKNFILGVIMLLAVAFILRLYGKKRGGLGHLVGRLCLKLPFLRSLVAKRNLAHMSSVLEKLLAAGVPLNTSLESAASMDVNPIYANCFLRMKEQVERGNSLRSAMEEEHHSLPASFRSLVSLGESSGLLPEAFRQLALLYRRESIRTARTLLDVTTPLVVCIVGGLTFLVYYSCFMAIFKLSTAVSGSI